MSGRGVGRLLALGLSAFAANAAAEPVPVATTAPMPTTAPVVATPPGDLQSPAQRDTRNSAYSLPRGTWAVDAGALGLGGGDAYAKLGVAYGLGAGVQLEINLAHMSVGLMNLSAYWQFVDTPHFALAARAGVWYGQGKWIWILNDVGSDLVGNLSVLNVPLVLASSMPISKRLQFDLDAQYTYVDIFGSVTTNGSRLRDAPFGLRQFAARPGIRLFLTDSTELDLSTRLPFYSSRTYVLPHQDTGDSDHAEFKKIPFSETWAAEVGLRSRLSQVLFGTVRFHYSKIARGLYGAAVYPSFDLEARF